MVLPPWIIDLIAQAVAATVREVLKNLPAIAAAWRQAMASTAVEAPAATPEQIKAAQDAYYDAVAAGKAESL
jgi:hypothetical protein